MIHILIMNNYRLTHLITCCLLFVRLVTLLLSAGERERERERDIIKEKGERNNDVEARILFIY